MHSHGSAVSSRKLVWRISCVCTRNTSQQFHSGTKTSVQKIVPYPTTPTKLHGSFEEFSIAKWFPMLQAKYFLKESDCGQSSTTLLHTQHFQGPRRILPLFCLNLGLTKLKACLSSTVALLALPVKRIYAEIKGTDISSTIRPTASACHIQLNVYFFISQLNRKWKVREAPLQNKEPVI